MSAFIGRENHVETIRQAVVDHDPSGRVRIISIGGPGGVGKSFMLDHALSDLDLPQLGYLDLRVDGNTSSATLADLLVRDLIATKSPSLAGDPKYFRVTREGWDQLHRMDASARAELEVTVKNDDNLARAIGMFYDGTVGLLEVFPNEMSRRAGRVGKKLRGQDVEKVIAAARLARAYREEKGHLFGVLPIRHAARERNLLRKDLSGRLAEYLLTDLSAILSGYRSEDWKRYLPSKVDGMDRCLIVLDDYETLQDTLDGFLRHDLLPRLRKAKFQTLLIVLGRDSLRDVDFSWEQYFGGEIVSEVRLAPLSESESSAYLESLGIREAATVQRIWRDSLGLPFLLAAEAEWEMQGGGSALSLQKFVNRTMRWMTQEQKSWAVALAFLEEVSADTVKRVLPDCDAGEVMNWFKQEASIRSPETGTWRMLPLIRSRIQASVRNDSPSQYRLLQEKGQST